MDKEWHESSCEWWRKSVCSFFGKTDPKRQSIKRHLSTSKLYDQKRKEKDLKIEEWHTELCATKSIDNKIKDRAYQLESEIKKYIRQVRINTFYCHWKDVPKWHINIEIKLQPRRGVFCESYSWKLFFNPLKITFEGAYVLLEVTLTENNLLHSDLPIYLITIYFHFRTPRIC